MEESVLRKFRIVEHSYQNGDEFPILVGDEIYVCFGGVELHDHNKTLQFKDCSKPINVDENYDGDVDIQKIDIYLTNHLWGNPYAIETMFFKDELIETIVQ